MTSDLTADERALSEVTKLIAAGNEVHSLEGQHEPVSHQR